MRLLTQFILTMLRICRHEHISRPWRNMHSKVDYITCFDCASELVSPIQFAKRKETFNGSD
jgi:hypothetical protein